MMTSDLKNIPVTLNIDFSQFMLFFEQLPLEYKKMVLFSLENKIKEKYSNKEVWKSLQGSVLEYYFPFEPIATEDWEAIQ